MSVIRQHSFSFLSNRNFNRQPDRFRAAGESEILLLADSQVAHRVTNVLKENSFSVHTAGTSVEAMKEITRHEFAAVIYDTSLPDFPVADFYSAVEKNRPALLPRFIFLVDEQSDATTLEFIERVDGLKVWRPIEADELLQMIEMVRDGHLVEPAHA
jgi:DNA-binding NarL/FixJ family response regulator